MMIQKLIVHAVNKQERRKQMQTKSKLLCKIYGLLRRKNKDKKPVPEQVFLSQCKKPFQGLPIEARSLGLRLVVLKNNKAA